MNALMGLIADFVERLADPGFGRQVNEAYNFRIGVLLDNDENMSAQLANTDLGADDVPSLSFASWLWYLRWRMLHGGPLPGDDFLTGLYDATIEPIVRFRVVDTVVVQFRRDLGTAELTGQRWRRLSDLPDSWLRRRMESIIGGRQEHEDEATGAEQARRLAREQAWELAAYLLQLGDDVSLAILGALLSEQWDGASDLVARVEAVLARPGLERDAVGRLRELLDLPSAQ
jgi:hypothetical protein